MLLSGVFGPCHKFLPQSGTGRSTLITATEIDTLAISSYSYHGQRRLPIELTTKANAYLFSTPVSVGDWTRSPE